jgi:hypothetical protein
MKIEKLNKGSIFFAPALAAIAMGLAFSTAFAANMPKNCVEEFMSFSKKES